MDDAYDIKRRMYDRINEDSVKYDRSSSTIVHPYSKQQDNSSDYEKNNNRPVPAAVAIESLFNKPSSSSPYNNISSSSLHVGGHDQRQPQQDGGSSIYAQQFNSRYNRVDDSIAAPTQKFIQHSIERTRTLPVSTSDSSTYSDVPFHDPHPTTIYTADDLNHYIHHQQPPPFFSSSSNDDFNRSPTADPTTSLLSRQPISAPTNATAATSSSRQGLLSSLHHSSLEVALTSSIPPLHGDRLSTLKDHEEDHGVSSSSPTTGIDKIVAS